jgi:hypothetical protein
VLAVPALRLTLALPDNGSAASGTSQRMAFDTISSAFGPGYNGPLLVVANLTPGAHPAAAARQADTVAAKLKGFADVAAVTPPQLDQAHTTALIDVVPASAPPPPPPPLWSPPSATRPTPSATPPASPSPSPAPPPSTSTSRPSCPPPCCRSPASSSACRSCC